MSNSSSSGGRNILSAYGASVVAISTNQLVNLLAFAVPNFIALISELISLVTFYRIRVRKEIFVYLKAYTINNALVCILSGLQFQIFSFDLINSQALAWIMAYLSIPGMFACYMLTILLDIAILVDRLSTFSARVRALLAKATPIKICIALTLFSLLFNIPFLFFFELVQIKTPTRIIWLLGLTSFYKSVEGTVCLYIVKIFRSVVLMIVQISLTFIFTYHIRAHYRQKSAITAITTSQTQSSLRRGEISTWLMVIVMVTLTLIEQVIAILDAVYSLRLALLLSYFVSARRLLDFFIYFAFNTVFRSAFLSFRKTRSGQTRTSAYHSQNATR